MNEAVPLVAFWMAVVLLAAVLVLTLVLVFVRTLRGFVRPRAAARESRIRGLLVEGLLGDRGEEANHSLLAMRGRDGDTLEHQAARMVVRLKGEVLDQVRSLLLDRGVGPRAQALARSEAQYDAAAARTCSGPLPHRSTCPTCCACSMTRSSRYDVSP